MPNRSTVEKMIDQPAGPGVFSGAIGFADPDVSRTHRFVDDFFEYDTTATVGRYKTTADGTVVLALQDLAGGVFGVKTQASIPADNDEAYLSSQKDGWLFADYKHLWFEARVKLTEANTDDANIIVGLSDTVGANTLLDNGAGPAASYDGAVFFKVDGGTVWQTEVSDAGTQQTHTNAGAFTSGGWSRLGLHFDAQATTGKVQFYLDGQAVGDPRSITNANFASPMSFLLGVKNGGANQEEVLIDYVQVIQVR